MRYICLCARDSRHCKYVFGMDLENQDLWEKHYFPKGQKPQNNSEIICKARYNVKRYN